MKKLAILSIAALVFAASTVQAAVVKSTNFVAKCKNGACSKKKQTK